MEIMADSTNVEKEVAIPMLDRLQQIEEEVRIEKEKGRDCRSAMKKSLDSLCELLNGEELSEEKKVETQEPMPSLGGPDVRPE